MFYIHKHEITLNYGGPEEGGWWYESGVPVEDWKPIAFVDEEAAYEQCRQLNTAEKVRQEEEEEYDFTSVLSYRSHHYAYMVDETSEMRAYPEQRPHYE